MTKSLEASDDALPLLAAVDGDAEVRRRIFTTESVILGFVLGSLLFGWSVWAVCTGSLPKSSAVEETLWVALYLTAVVAFCSFRLPTPFAGTRPRLAVFALAMVCGHVSLLFDSFAVVLLLLRIELAPATGIPPGRHRFNAFMLKAVCAFNALTVGGAFYLGELWGLPHYIASGMDDPLAGLPLLLVVTPYCILTSWACAARFPVRIEPVRFERDQIMGTCEIVSFLFLLVFTHNVFACLGTLLVYSAVKRQTPQLVERTAHELAGGGMNAIGLILAALVLQRFPWATDWFASQVTGPMIVLASGLSSPFAGAMIAPAADPAQFYWNISYLMVGAPLFVWSSLVAIMVFKESLATGDLPAPLRRLAVGSSGHVQEAVAYTVVVIPLSAGLLLCLVAANALGIFPAVYGWLHG